MVNRTGLAQRGSLFPRLRGQSARPQPGRGIILVEIKGNHILNGEDTLDKAAAEHKAYGRPLMLVREESGRFMTVRYDEQSDKNYLDQVFRIEGLPGY